MLVSPPKDFACDAACGCCRAVHFWTRVWRQSAPLRSRPQQMRILRSKGAKEARMHLLPCGIASNGSARVETFFNSTVESEGVAENGAARKQRHELKPLISEANTCIQITHSCPRPCFLPDHALQASPASPRGFAGGCCAAWRAQCQTRSPACYCVSRHPTRMGSPWPPEVRHLTPRLQRRKTIVTATFREVTQWNLESVPSRDDAVAKVGLHCRPALIDDSASGAGLARAGRAGLHSCACIAALIVHAAARAVATAAERVIWDA